MSISNFVPELWSAAVLVPRESALVFGQPSCVNRDYEGEIKQQGDTVHVTSIGDPTVRTYDKTTDLTEEDLSDSSDELVIDQGDYFNFRVNDVDRVQAAGNFQTPATMRAGYKMAAQIDSFLSGLMLAGADDDNRMEVQSISKSSPEDAYNLIVDLGVLLDEADEPEAGRFVVVSPSFHGVLRRDDRFIRQDASGTTDGLRNALVGRAAGFDILKSNRAPGVRTVSDAVTTASSKTLTSATAKFTQNDVGALVDDGGTKITTGTTIASVESATSVTMSANAAAAGTGIALTIGSTGQSLVIAGTADATSLAVQITEVEALRSQTRFADKIRGLQVYGAKVFRPKGLATAYAKVS